MLKPFSTRYLSAEQIGQMFSNWLASVEAQCLEAWTRYQLSPHDPVLRATYEHYKEQLEWLEEEQKRLTDAKGEV